MCECTCCWSSGQHLQITFISILSNQFYLYSQKLQSHCLSGLYNLYSDRHPLSFVWPSIQVRAGAVLGGPNRGQCPHNSESGPPCGPPDRESASIIQWQISCNDFVLKGKAEIKCLSSLLPNQNCWNCKHWLYVPPMPAPNLAPLLKLVENHHCLWDPSPRTDIHTIDVTCTEKTNKSQFISYIVRMSDTNDNISKVCGSRSGPSRMRHCQVMPETHNLLSATVTWKRAGHTR